MKRSLTILIAILVSVIVCQAAMSLEADAQREAVLLNSELRLAKKPVIYFIFDLKQRKILLKSRGLVLREMKISDMSVWGDPVDATARAVIRKSTLFEPKRTNIDPNKNKEEETNTNTTPGAFEVEALELQDMPGNYRVEFSGGISLSVRSASQGLMQKVTGAANYIGWYVTRPLLTVWNAVRGRPFTSLYVTLDEEDARSVYWSLVEKSENIIYLP